MIKQSAISTSQARSRDFGLFWLAQSASVTGDQVREFAVPLIAVTVLHVSATGLGILGAAQWLPVLVLALPLGVLIDRHRRRRMLLLSESVRGILTLGLVVAALTGALQFPVLLIGVVALGAFTVLYEVGYQSAIPALVPRQDLERANSRTQATAAAAEVGGPGLGGLMLQLLGVPAALAVNAATYVVSAGALLMMRSVEPEPPKTRRDFAGELRAGAAHVLGDPYLKANVGFSAIYNPFAQWVTLLLTLYAVQNLGLEPAQLGLVFSIGAAGALIGAATTARIAARLAVGRMLVACAAVECLALLALPVVDPGWGTGWAIAALSGLMALNGAGTAVSNVLLITIRQLRTPDHMLGRVNATMRTVTYGTIPLGALAGGFVGSWLGPRLGLLVGAALCLTTIVWVALSPLRGIRRLNQLAVSDSSAAPVTPADRAPRASIRRRDHRPSPPTA